MFSAFLVNHSMVDVGDCSMYTWKGCLVCSWVECLTRVRSCWLLVWCLMVFRLWVLPGIAWRVLTSPAVTGISGFTLSSGRLCLMYFEALLLDSLTQFLRLFSKLKPLSIYNPPFPTLFLNTLFAINSINPAFFGLYILFHSSNFNAFVLLY